MEYILNLANNDAIYIILVIISTVLILSLLGYIISKVSNKDVVIKSSSTEVEINNEIK